MAAPLEIIIATDGSEAALEAAHRALELLRPDAHVTLVAVIAAPEDPMADAGGFEGPVMTPEQAEEDWREELARGGKALARTALEAHGDVETMLVPSEEPAGPAIVRIAKERRADVLVIGSERPGFFERLFGHSVTDQVVHHAPCPVLVVPHNTHE